MPENNRATSPDAIFRHVDKVIVNGKEYSSLDEMPLEIHAICLDALAAINQNARDHEVERSGSTAGFPRHLVIDDVATAVDEQSGTVNSQEDRPGYGCFIAMLAALTLFYVMTIVVPGRRESLDRWIARRPTWREFLVTWTFVVVPLSALLWGGFYFFGERFLKALLFGVKLIVVVVIVSFIIAIVAMLLGL